MQKLQFYWIGQSPRPVPIEGSSVIQARSIFTADGLWWWLSSLVKNFIEFPPLGIVLVGMLGIGLAEKSGLLSALIMLAGNALQEKYLIPSVIFLGIMSSMALDAGYVVLPPLAALLFLSVGRSPILGIVASFAGVSAGFCANLFVTSIDPMLAGFTEAAAQIIDADYRVAVTSNWWFMAVSTVTLTFTGWWVTERWVASRTHEYSVPENLSLDKINLSAKESKAVRWSMLSLAILFALILATIFIPNSALHGEGTRFARWVEATVPLLFLIFIVPGTVYGYVAGTIKNSRDFAKHLGQTMSEMGPYIVLAFFAAQFIAVFKYTYLGQMFAFSGGVWLASLQLEVFVLLLAFVLLACIGNLFIGSMSAKYAFMAPVFVPMLMQAGVAPELTQAAYRIGDSVTNVITPFNPYMIIVLAALQKYQPKAGIGTLVSLTLPYSIAFLLMWLVLFGIWLLLGVPLGPGGSY